MVKKRRKRRPKAVAIELTDRQWARAKPVLRRRYAGPIGVVVHRTTRTFVDATFASSKKGLWCRPNPSPQAGEESSLSLLPNSLPFAVPLIAWTRPYRQRCRQLFRNFFVPR
jgi:hypothetical protein